MEIEFRLSETGRGIWIQGNVFYHEQVLSQIPVWKSFNKKRNSWLIFKSDLPIVIEFLTKSNVPFKKDEGLYPGFCDKASEYASKSNFVCDPHSGLWIGASSQLGKNLLQEYPELIKKLPPYKAPTKEKFYREHQNLNNVCAYFLKYSRDSRDIRSARKRMLREFSIRIGKKDSMYWDEDDITPLFSSIDREYFRNQIMRFMNRKNMKLRVKPNSVMTKNINGKCRDGKFHEQCTHVIELSTVPTKNEDEECIDLYGIKCCGAMECLLVAFEHQIIHLVVELFCKDKTTHNKAFQTLARNIFGHTSFEPHPISDISSGVNKQVVTKGPVFQKKDFHIDDSAIYLDNDNFMWRLKIKDVSDKSTFVGRGMGKKFKIPYNSKRIITILHQ